MKEQHKNTKEAYTGGSNSMERKEGYAAVFTRILTEVVLYLKKPPFTQVK